MNLKSLKNLFTNHFNLTACAANARKIINQFNITLEKIDFRCKRTWEALLQAFNLFTPNPYRHRRQTLQEFLLECEQYGEFDDLEECINYVPTEKDLLLDRLIPDN